MKFILLATAHSDLSFRRLKSPIAADVLYMAQIKSLLVRFRNVRANSFFFVSIASSFEMWCWRRTEKISWTDHVRNEEVLLRVKEQRNILHKISKRKASWFGHILHRNCLLRRVIEGKIKGG